MKDSKIPVILYTIGVAIISIVVGFILGRVIPDKEKSGTEMKKETVISKEAVNPVPVSEKPVGSISVPVELDLKAPDDPQLPQGEILLFKPHSKEGGGFKRGCTERHVSCNCTTDQKRIQGQRLHSLCERLPRKP